jgi:hypothetical protein
LMEPPASWPLQINPDPSRPILATFTSESLGLSECTP